MSSSAAEIFQLASQERALFWCVLASLALHALVFLGMSWEPPPAPPALLVLTARLAPFAVAPNAAEQAPQAKVAPPPEHVTPPRHAAIKPAISPPPPTQTAAPADAPKPPEPETTGSGESGTKPAAPVQAKVAPVPSVGAPTAESGAKSGNELDAGIREQYRRALMAATRRYKRYPAIAMEKGWQGKVEVHMVIGANGMLADATIKTTSGHEILDNQAIDMLKKGKTTVQIPASLRGREFSVDVPVIFNLDDPSS